MSIDLEDQLRQSLRPVDPAEGFADRVMARIEIRQQPRRSRWLPVALAASAVLGLAFVHERQAQREQQGLEARQQLIDALRVTGEKLDLAYRVVNRKDA